MGVLYRFQRTNIISLLHRLLYVSLYIFTEISRYLLYDFRRVNINFFKKKYINIF